jgi:hypothetical protein
MFGLKEWIEGLFRSISRTDSTERSYISRTPTIWDSERWAQTKHVRLPVAHTPVGAAGVTYLPPFNTAILITDASYITNTVIDMCFLSVSDSAADASDYRTLMYRPRVLNPTLSRPVSMLVGEGPFLVPAGTVVGLSTVAGAGVARTGLLFISYIEVVT